jgi:hypothetical protein
MQNTVSINKLKVPYSRDQNPEFYSEIHGAFKGLRSTK